MNAKHDYLHRIDVALSGGRNLAFILDHDGEVLLRVFRRQSEKHPHGQWGSPEIRITIGDLLEIREAKELRRYEFGPVLIRAHEQGVEVFQDPHGRGHKIEGFTGRQLFDWKIDEFLSAGIVQERAAGT
ncbi:MAG: hypothetical protein ACO1SV_27735 [Fimbriimonas sp.]